MILTADLLATTNLLAAMVWVGGLVAVAVATVAARASLGEGEQVEFFRALGKRYGMVSGIALMVFAVSGLALLGDPATWSSRERITVLLVIAVIGLTVAGVRAARHTQRVAAETLAEPADAGAQANLARSRRVSGDLRILIAVATLAAVLVATL